MTTDQREQLLELVERLTTATLDADGRVQLQNLLAGDVEAQDVYTDYMHLHASIMYWSGGEKEAISSQPLAVSDQPSASFDAHPTPRSKSWLDRASRHPLMPSIGVAVAIFVAVVLAAALTPVGQWIAGGGGDDKNDLKPAAEPEFVARLSNWHNAVWLDDTRPPLRDPRLAVGRRLVLGSGFAEITYDTGARVLLEGPAEFEVLTLKEGRLQVGKATVLCAVKRAEGFVIDTPTTRFEDLGTEFGVVVMASGAARFASWSSADAHSQFSSRDAVETLTTCNVDD